MELKYLKTLILESGGGPARWLAFFIVSSVPCVLNHGLDSNHEVRGKLGDLT